jgi:hypothetical protein
MDFQIDRDSFLVWFYSLPKCSVPHMHQVANPSLVAETNLRFIMSYHWFGLTFKGDKLVIS